MDALGTADIIVIIIAFLAGGLVKGMLGIGLPLMAIPILSLKIGVTDAIVLNVVPILVSNIWQSFAGGMFVPVLRKFWLLILVFVLVMIPTTALLRVLAGAGMDLALGTALLGAIGLLLTNPVLDIPERWHWLVSIGIGILAGLVGGVTSLTGLPLILYLVALRLPKDEFVASISVMYLAAGVALVIGMIQNDLFTPAHLLVSTVALIPVGAGMAVGQWLRGFIDQPTMRKAVLLVLFVIALGLLRRGVLGFL